MATINGSVTLNTNKYTCYSVVIEIDINAINHTSKVTVAFHIARTNWGWIAGAYSGSIVIDGTQYNFSYSPNWSAGSSGDVTIATASKVVTHNADGTKSCSVSATWNTSGTYSCGTASASGSVTLTTIPRESQITASDADIGSVSQIIINKNVESYTTTLKYKFETQSTWTTIVTKTTASSYAFDVPTSFYALIPNSATGTC